MWRTIFAVTALVITVSAIVACTSESGEGASSPKGAVQRMLAALEAGDTNKMLDAYDPDRRSGDPIGQALLFLFQGFLSGPAGNIKFKNMSFSVEQQEGDYAAVRAKGKVRAAFSENDFDEVMTTRRVNGRWYVTDDQSAPWKLATATAAQAQAQATSDAHAAATATADPGYVATAGLVEVEAVRLEFTPRGEFQPGVPIYWASLTAEVVNHDSVAHEVYTSIRAEPGKSRDCPADFVAVTSGPVTIPPKGTHHIDGRDLKSGIVGQKCFEWPSINQSEYRVSVSLSGS